MPKLTPEQKASRAAARLANRQLNEEISHELRDKMGREHRAARLRTETKAFLLEMRPRLGRAVELLALIEDQAEAAFRADDMLCSLDRGEFQKALAAVDGLLDFVADAFGLVPVEQAA